MRQEYNKDSISRFLHLFIGFYRFVRTDTKNNKNQEKIEDMKRKVEKIANQKKTNLNPQEKEINNYKNLGMAR